MGRGNIVYMQPALPVPVQRRTAASHAYLPETKNQTIRRVIEHLNLQFLTRVVEMHDGIE